MLTDETQESNDEVNQSQSTYAMPLRVKCLHCKVQLSVKDELAGKRIKCPKCGQPVSVTAAAPAANPASESESGLSKAQPSAERKTPGKLKQPAAAKPAVKNPGAAASKSQRPADPENDELNLFGEQEAGGADDDAAWSDDYGDQNDFDDPYPSRPPAPRTNRESIEKSNSRNTASRSGTNDPGTTHKPWIIGVVGSAVGLVLGLGIGYLAFSSSSTNSATGNTPAPVAGTPATSSTASTNSPGTGTSQENSQGAENATGSNTPGTKSQSTLPPPRPEPTAEQLAEASDLKRVIGKMEEVLKAGNDEEFLKHYAPYDVIAAMRKADKTGQNSPPPTIPRDRLLTAISALSGEIADVNPQMTTATLRVEVQGGTSSEWAPAAGYEGDVHSAISNAITDLEQDKFSDFARNMFPPDALTAMFSNGPEHSFAAKVTKDSALVVRMLQDLKALQSEQPQISGDVAEFTLPPVEWDDARSSQIRPAGERYPPQDRIIRFSRINGRWRFYDDGSLRQTSALSGTLIELNFERIGHNWRLSAYPRS